MKNKIENELRQKEFENSLGRDLKLESSKQDFEDLKFKDNNKYVITAIYFFGTLLFGYIFLFMTRYIFNVMFGTAIGFAGIDMTLIYIPIHAGIFIMAVISAVKRRSVIDRILNRFI